VSTFAQWLAAQEDRDDRTGWLARHWAGVTPGRISSVTGVMRHLERRLSDLQAADPGDDRVAATELAEAARQAALAVEAAREGAAEYARSQLRAQAERAGLALLPAPAGAADPGAAPGDHRVASSGYRRAEAPQGDAEPISAPGAGDPVPGAAAAVQGGLAAREAIEARLDRVESMLTRTLERQDKIIELLSALVFPENRAPQYAGRHAAHVFDVHQPENTRTDNGIMRSFQDGGGGWDWGALARAAAGG